MSVFEELNGVDSECRSYLVADSGEAMIVDPKTGRSRPPANYQNTVRDANRVCAPELSAQ